MIQDFWASIIKWDQSLFELINGSWSSPNLDLFLSWMRTAENWIPLYLFLLGFLFYKWGWKAWKWVLGAVVTISMTDQVSSFFFKPLLHRLRPCADPAMISHVKLVIGACPSSFSFTSSHATNHFGIAMFIFMTLQPFFKKYTYLFFLWAALISYAQVYVGVHYPLDVVAGSILGLTIGYVFARLFLNWSTPRIK